MEKIKAIADRYKVQKTLFKVNNYLYARIFDKHTLDTVFGCVYVYENEQPGQILKMLLEKFSHTSKMSNLIFPSFHAKDNDMHDKSVSIFFMQKQVASLCIFTQDQYDAINISQMLKFTYDAFCSLHYLHSHDIIHGNISLSTCYISKNDRDIDFALNILDTSAFHDELIKSSEMMIFRSQAQQNGLKTSYKDDAQCLIYILLHLISKGKMFSKERYRKEWINSNELLRWKTMDFFKQMVETLPTELGFLTQIFTIIKSLSRHQKPDYPKFIKKTFSKLKEKQNIDIHISHKKITARRISIDRKEEIHLANNKKFQVNKNKSENHENLKNQSSQQQKQKPKSQQKIQKILQLEKPKPLLANEDEEDMLLIIESDKEENQLNEKYSKLDTTKCTTKTKSFWTEKVVSQG